MEYIHTYTSPVGIIYMASDGTSLTGLWFENQKYFESTLSKNPVHKNLPIFDKTRQWLDIYFSNKEPDFTPPLSYKGTSFQQEVWSILLNIPYGTYITYKDIANQIAKQRNISTMSSQAVGQAVGHNPISIIIPCHRVIGTNKHITGYAGGIDIKLKLLEIEKVDVSILKGISL